MGEKVKVTKEIAEIVDRLSKLYGRDKFLKLHCTIETWGLDKNKPLNYLSKMKLATILVNGYEVEKTPKELLEDFEIEHLNNRASGQYRHGVTTTIQFFKENFTIKGINDDE